MWLRLPLLVTFSCVVLLLLDPNQNTDSSCSYHANKPVFHDTIKYYSCCPDDQAYDWDAFMKIKGCQTGKHD